MELKEIRLEGAHGIHSRQQGLEMGDGVVLAESSDRLTKLTAGLKMCCGRKCRQT